MWKVYAVVYLAAVAGYLLGWWHGRAFLRLQGPPAPVGRDAWHGEEDWGDL